MRSFSAETLTARRERRHANPHVPLDARLGDVKGVVTDLDTGSQWMVFGARCPDGCYCDATVRLMEAEN